MIGSANDYQLANGGKNETIFSRAHVTVRRRQDVDDRTRSTSTATSPPATLPLRSTQRATRISRRSASASARARRPARTPTSSSRRRPTAATTWTTATRVASGSGSFGSVGIFNDKEYIAAWGDGNAIVTWSRFNDLQQGRVRRLADLRVGHARRRQDVVERRRDLRRCLVLRELHRRLRPESELDTGRRCQTARSTSRS